MRMMEINEDLLQLMSTTIAACDQSKHPIHGKLILEFRCVPKSVPTEFYVVDTLASFELIVCRLWIEAMDMVTFTRHQCCKYLYKGKIIKVRGDNHEGRKIYTCQ